MSRNNNTQQLKIPVTPGSPTDADPGRTSCASRAAASVRPAIGLDPTEGRGPSPYSSALAAAERVEAPPPGAPLPLPPLLPLPEPLPLPLLPPPPLLPPLPPPPPAPALPLPLPFLAGAPPDAAPLAATPPSADPPPVADLRLLPLPALRAGPTCVNTQLSPKRHLPVDPHCRHSPSPTLVAIVGAGRDCWTSAVIRPPRSM